MGYSGLCALLFFLIFFLVGVFHLFLWDSGLWGFVSGFRSWVGSFECGFISQGVSENYFSWTYFILLVFFVVFDLEISLLLNLPLQGLLFKNLPYYVCFVVLLCFGFGIEVNKGYVEWSY
uniref:NADH-ubiquinone oxidoreductase chain 3 n=1 Tax=Haplorchis taichui TaxID=235153 RepID=A0A3G4YLF6_9TREM|nr:NADH dehydrogenase subunit 3 [Haplorchis taichui]